jgi:hypothetical protein
MKEAQSQSHGGVSPIVVVAWRHMGAEPTSPFCQKVTDDNLRKV